jgi:hypothetical protein
MSPPWFGSSLEAPDTRHRVVLVAAARVRGALLPVVEAACASARARMVAWDGEKLPDGLTPTLAISTLAPGERRIPDALARLMTHDAPGLPLLLLTHDELVRPTVSLQEGRVTLLGPALTAERISARVRILLADHDAGSTAGTMPFGVGSRARCRATEQTTPHAYLGTFSTGGLEGDAAEHAPLVEVAEDGGVTVLLSVSGAPSFEHLARTAEALGPSGVTPSTSQALGADEDDERREILLSNAIGASTGMIHCSPTLEWLAHWPEPTFGLLLSSATRLPPVWNFADALGRGQHTSLRLPGATGDVLLALWGLPWAARPFDQHRLLAAAHVGGPQVLDLLVSALNSAEHPAAGLVMELR